jgi:hypothetical protein
MNRYQSISRVADPVPPVRPVIGPIRVVDSLAVPLSYRPGEVIYSAERSVGCWYRVLYHSCRSAVRLAAWRVALAPGRF